MSVRLNWYTELKRSRAAQTAGTVASTAKDGIGMTNGSARVSATAAITCPACETEGDPSTLRTSEYFGRCGSRWSGRGDFYGSAQCRIIYDLRLELAEARLEIDGLKNAIEILRGEAA